MRKDFGAKPLSFPQPVLILASYDKNGNADAMNAAWGGITGDNEITMCIGKAHRSTENILERKALTISMGDAAHVTACDYVGLESGCQVDNKLEKAGFTVTKSKFVDAPVINELAVCLECRLKSYDQANGHMVCEIVNVSVDESVLTDGKVDVMKAAPITFDPFNYAYHVIGEKVGNAFADGKVLK